MKNLFILIGLLMTLSVSSQTTLTQKEKQILLNVLTKEKVIDISKAISHEKELDSVVKVRDKQIKDLQEKIEQLKDEHNKALKEIAIASYQAQQTNQSIDSIQKPKKRFWQNIHLDIGTKYYFDPFRKGIYYETVLYYNVKRFTLSAGINSNTRYTFGISYRLF